MSDPKPEEKIYLTYKTRMTTEARLRKTALTFHLLLSWYSLCLIVLSVIDVSRRFEIESANIISACVSVAIFGLSLFIYGERYSERADEFKNCYLKLKSLYESSTHIEDKMIRYAGILAQYDNQSDEDYDEMLFDACMRGQELRNAHGSVRITKVVFCRVLFSRIARSASIAALFVAPIVAGLLWIRPTAAA
jgi:hypothetical protein